VILCATDIAKKFKQTPIEVVNIRQADFSVNVPNNEQRMTRKCIQDLYDCTGYTADDLDFMICADMDLLDMIDSAEASGYLPQGKGWEYFRDGRTRFDSDKPMNTNGGGHSFGHAYGATALAMYGEAVKQMRGQAGERQINPPPKVTLYKGQGATHSASAAILRTVEK